MSLATLLMPIILHWGLMGNWVDNTSGGKQPLGSEPMAIRYSETRLLSSCQVKRICLVAASKTCAHACLASVRQRESVQSLATDAANNIVAYFGP